MEPKKPTQRAFDAPAHASKVMRLRSMFGDESVDAKPMPQVAGGLTVVRFVDHNWSGQRRGRPRLPRTARTFTTGGGKC
jgi:hypothetical protein